MVARTLIVFGAKTFKITIPDEAKVTFGPWSPPDKAARGYTDTSGKGMNGTLRVYESKAPNASVMAVFSNVTGYRDTSLLYEEEVAREEGAIIWKSDQDGYKREEKVNRSSTWTAPQIGSGDDDF